MNISSFSKTDSCLLLWVAASRGGSVSPEFKPSYIIRKTRFFSFVGVTCLKGSLKKDGVRQPLLSWIHPLCCTCNRLWLLESGSWSFEWILASFYHLSLFMFCHPFTHARKVGDSLFFLSPLYSLRLKFSRHFFLTLCLSKAQLSLCDLLV